MARVVVPGFPHHITQRGNRRENIFFVRSDYRRYLRLLGDYAAERGLDILAYCLMPNHVHLIAVPASERGLSRAIGELTVDLDWLKKKSKQLGL